jgi:hypothetical protein
VAVAGRRAAGWRADKRARKLGLGQSNGRENALTSKWVSNFLKADFVGFCVFASAERAFRPGNVNQLHKDCSLPALGPERIRGAQRFIDTEASLGGPR